MLIGKLQPKGKTIMFYSFADHRANPDILWNDERHATVYYLGRIWEVREDEASDWLIFVSGRTEPVHRITSGGYSEAFRWIAGRPRS
jgi:hypothetical protein